MCSSSRRSLRSVAVRALILGQLILHVTVGQQYTGVKLVSPGEEQRQVPAHSARSVDDVGLSPARDSNIINLSIKPLSRGQGFTAAKGRNLGFVSDASLNTIPAGINNELSNVDVRPSTTTHQASAGLRDSYGNPVTPFTDLANANADHAVGFQTNVNRESGFPASRNGGVVVGGQQQLAFKVPSYASGIIAPIAQPNFSLLPPNAAASTGLPPRQQTQPLAPQQQQQQQQFVPDAKIPVLQDGQILFAQKPVNGLLPPLFPDQLPAVYPLVMNVGTERSPIFARDPFTDPATAAIPNNGVGFKTDVNKQTHFSGSFPQVPVAPPADTVRPQHQQAPSQPSPPQLGQSVAGPTPTKAPPVQKYTGGFGGPAGFLGSQQNIGTAYTSTPKSVVAPPPVVQPLPPPQATFRPTARPVEQTTVTKYTGGFGGPAGFLGNQQTIGTAYTEQPVAGVGTPPTAPRPAPVPAPVSSGPVSNVFPTQQQLLPSTARPVTQPPPNKFTGSFGFGSNNQGVGGSGARPTTVSSFAPQQQQTPQPVGRPQSFNAGNKFTGTFGGAPGLLGNQPLGTHVKPDGTILPPSAPGGFSAVTAPAHQQHQHTQQLSVSDSAGNRFSGSFGGPPGVLRPFDNTKG
ncbi:BRD4-interacting chromatin-remodeling complex-associated protein-like [Anopheles bellator]|uniref:BRD4-interacting chromatin-remodeling complex-associated protein-like n=1 Tax=Anopheles bellator TaxID=139047 RepID=UPI002647E420|nr:BRD4-interacting chromatin-remodeling complex-associated protein-like [Anopheles bellator]